MTASWLFTLVPRFEHRHSKKQWVCQLTYARNRAVPGPIPYITRSSLWNAWKAIRKELRSASRRDIIDHLEYDIDPNVWINRLLKQVNQSRYEPSTPSQFTLGKSLGFSRTMTLPAIPDLVLYRTIVDFIYKKSTRHEQKHVYFRREFLHKAQRLVADEAKKLVNEAAAAAEYRVDEKRFLTWLRYGQYRKYLITAKIHPYFVITDVANFFDSVLHSHVAEALRGLSIPPRMIGLLFFLLERLSIRQDYTDSHRISLPVDEFDCSRALAHIVLFEHDRVMVELVGEDDYVRWMDDQNIGVASRAEGLKVLAHLGKSLARLHLTANAKKSAILTLAEARRHFHLDLNQMLDDAFESAKSLPKGKQAFKRLIKTIWHKAEKHKGQGEFDKILSRLYHLAGRANLKIFHMRSLEDILNKPDMAERVCEYMRCTSSPMDYLRFAQTVFSSEEQVYPDVSVIVIESLLRIETRGQTASKIGVVASALLKDRLPIAGASDCKAIAPLLIFRFGQRRSRSLLAKCIEDDSGRNSAMVVRACALIYASFGLIEYRFVRKAASRLLKSPLAEAIRMIERIRQYKSVPDRYKNRLGRRLDSVSGQLFLDMRSVLTARLLALSANSAVQKWIVDWKEGAIADRISEFDKQLVRKIFS